MSQRKNDRVDDEASDEKQIWELTSFMRTNQQEVNARHKYDVHEGLKTVDVTVHRENTDETDDQTRRSL